MLRGELFSRYASGDNGDSQVTTHLSEGREAVPRLGGDRKCTFVSLMMISYTDKHGPQNLTATLLPPGSSISAPATPTWSRTQPSTTSSLAPPASITSARPASVLSTASRLFRRPSKLLKSDETESLTVVDAPGVDGGLLVSIDDEKSRSSLAGRRRHPGIDALTTGRSTGMDLGGGSSKSSNSGGQASTQGGGASLNPRSYSQSSPSKSLRGSSTRFSSQDDQDDSLSTSSQSHSHRLPLPPMPSSADPFLFASSEREPTSQELKTEILELEQERKRLGESWQGLLRGAKDEKETEEIETRRKGTEERYDLRLDFLKARLRGAVIREKLPW